MSALDANLEQQLKEIDNNETEFYELAAKLIRMLSGYQLNLPAWQPIEGYSELHDAVTQNRKHIYVTFEFSSSYLNLNNPTKSKYKIDDWKREDTLGISCGIGLGDIPLSGLRNMFDFPRLEEGHKGTIKFTFEGFDDMARPTYRHRVRNCRILVVDRVLD